MLKKRSIALAGCVAILLVVLVTEQSPGQAFDPPSGGWAYIYHGDTAAGDLTAALDGTWDHDNGSSEWDGTGPGIGSNPGGAGVFTDGPDTFLRIQDTGDPTDYDMADPSNRKVYLTHDIGADGASDTFLDEGATLSFRARVPTTGTLDDLHPDGSGGIEPWPVAGNGLILTDGGKTSISLQQDAAGDNNMSITFALALPSDHEEAGATGGLLMNHLNGTERTGAIDTGEGGTPNLLPLSDPTAWHEFWIMIQPGGAGTHQATIWMDGDELNAFEFDLTAGNGTEEPFTSVLAMGSSATGGDGAVDVDFVAFSPFALIPGQVPGDVNGDKVVDLADLDIIRANYFELDRSLPEGDLNADSTVDFLDYRIWTENSSVGFAPLSVQVPEPASLGLALLGGVAIFGIRRRI